MPRGPGRAMVAPMPTYRGVELRYDCERGALPGWLRPRFAPLPFDEATRAWMDDAFERPHGRARLAAHRAALQVMSDYDANGMLDMHDMRVLGTAQWRALLGEPAGERLLDLGAGDGRVTQQLAPLVSQVVTTELSGQMRKRLRERGFVCHAVDVATEPLPEPEPFDLITALNLIDRMSHPLSLLDRVGELLASQGRLVLAVPLPLSPHVHVGALTVDPEEPLPIERASWEAAAASLAQRVLSPRGLVVERLARAPYLCRGTARQPVIALDDAIFLCRRGGAIEM